MAKGDPRVYPVEEYVRNRGNVGRKRIVFIGASYLFVHKVLRDMLIVGGFDECEVVVHDIDEAPLKIVGDLLEKIARQQKSKVTVKRTLDRREALTGADAVILSINVGGLEADCRAVEVCAKYNIPVTRGDTLGPAALARNLRSLPVLVRIARDMEEICPEAALLNFTNPMSCVTGVVGRETGITCWGLCHSADEMYQYFAEVFGVKKSEVRVALGGVNHQSFAVKVFIRGEDRTGELLEATERSEATLKDTLLATREEDVSLQQQIFRTLGVWPSTGAHHLAEFYPYFYTERRMDQLGLREHLQRVIPGRKPFGRKECPQIIREWTYGPGPVEDLHLLTTEHAHELLWSCFTGEPYTRVLNLLNRGPYIKGIGADACVEAQVTVSGKKVTGECVELPIAAHSLVERWTAVHELSIRAALDCDGDAARQALFLDPQVRDVYDIGPMLEDMLEAMGPWLGRKWSKRTGAKQR